MIGQKILLNKMWELVDNDKFPRFTILVGSKGSGKKLLSKEFVTGWNKSAKVEYVQLEDVKVDTIRSMIEEAYKIPYTYVYVIPDADKMSSAAKNALLKVTEEPPNNAYFIMTVEDESNLLDTIKSRGTLFHMDIYTPEEISVYAQCSNSRDLEIIVDVCEVPGDVDMLKAMNPEDVYSYVVSVLDGIAEVSDANAFKIATKVAFKDEADKYDLRLFWRIFMKACLDRMKQDPLRYANGIKITSRYLQELRITGISKTAAFDAWVLDIREAWCR